MSSTLSTNAMITKLQQKVPIGIGSTQWLDFLNEAFRKINQMQKGGFIWQLKLGTVSVPAGAMVPMALPTDFDPGKSAFLFGSAGVGVYRQIPFKTVSEFVTEQDFQVQNIGQFSSWTIKPILTFGPPTAYAWSILLAPDSAFPIAAPFSLQIWYHAVNFQPFTAANNVFFPTPDQFDSFILDLAEAEARREYSLAGWDKIVAQATGALNEIIGTYRTDRFDLAGSQDVIMQAQEKQAEGDK